MHVALPHLAQAGEKLSCLAALIRQVQPKSHVLLRQEREPLATQWRRTRPTRLRPAAPAKLVQGTGRDFPGLQASLSVAATLGPSQARIGDSAFIWPVLWASWLNLKHCVKQARTADAILIDGGLFRVSLFYCEQHPQLLVSTTKGPLTLFKPVGGSNRKAENMVVLRVLTVQSRVSGWTETRSCDDDFGYWLISGLTSEMPDQPWED
jgi:hypothetical protein